jgi:putative addiction module component (TIGR02574 family)
VKRKAVDILKEALALPSEERAALAASLLDSLDTVGDEDAEAAWAIEVNRRVSELDEGGQDYWLGRGPPPTLSELMPRPASDFIARQEGAARTSRTRSGGPSAGLTRQSSTSWPSLIGFAKSKKYAPLASVNQS